MTETWATTRGDHVTVFTRMSLRGPRWHWNVTASNGEIVASGEAYSRRIDAVTAAERHHPRIDFDPEGGRYGDPGDNGAS